MKKFVVILLIALFISWPFFSIRADEYDDITKQINDLNNYVHGKEADLQKVNQQLDDIKKQTGYLEDEIVKKEKEVFQGEKVLSYQKELLNERARSYYKNISKSAASLLTLLAGENLAESVHNFTYQKNLVDEDKNTIIKIVLYIRDLEKKKTELADEKSRLSVIKAQVDQLAATLAADITQTRQKIAELTARQEQLLAQKLASLNIPRSAATSLSGCIDDRGIDPGFSPRLAFFTYGVPNRVGMNQYGAYGRAKSGQNEEEILRAYYDNFELKKDYDSGININVEGYGSFNIEDYVKRIYEVPESWPMAALKAQAIAARSYALAYTNNGQGSICASEQCQVFKSEEKGGSWNQAVEETRGWVMVQGGAPIKAWYSSTHGGYVLKSSEIGWSDTSWTKHAVDASGNVGGFSDLQNSAYDRESPWFYCDWGSRSAYNKTAWLKSEEVADITNVILLAKQLTNIEDKEHLYQVDKPNPAGTDTWDTEKVKQELRNRGETPFNSVSDVSVSVDFSGGRATSVTVSGDAGSVSFDGREFKDWFNLRAPANIQIVGPLYNAERR